MATGIGVISIHHTITVLGDAHLLVLVNVGIETPTAGAGTPGSKGLGQRISSPKGGIVGIAVIVAIIPILLRIAA